MALGFFNTIIKVVHFKDEGFGDRTMFKIIVSLVIPCSVFDAFLWSSHLLRGSWHYSCLGVAEM